MYSVKVPLAKSEIWNVTFGHLLKQDIPSKITRKGKKYSDNKVRIRLNTGYKGEFQ